MDEISQPYARELARQVDELEAENARLRSENAELKHERDAMKAILQREYAAKHS